MIARNRRGQSGLWGYGISGDLPIVLLRIADRRNIELVRQLVQAHAYWRFKGLAADLVIWNEDQSGYRQALQEEILGVIGSSADASLLDKPGGIFVRRLEQMSDEDKVLMQTVARVIVDRLGRDAGRPDRPPRSAASRACLASPPRAAGERAVSPERRSKLRAARTWSHSTVSAVSRATAASTSSRPTADAPTPAPWVNVLANPWFGTVVSESGARTPGAKTRQSYRLTPWYNDPVSDTSGEAFYLRDEEDGRFWSPTPLPVRAADAVHHPSRFWLQRVRERGERHLVRAEDLRRDRCAGEVHRHEAAQPLGPAAAHVDDRLLRVGARRRSADESAPRRDRSRSQDRRDCFARNAYNSEFAQRIAFLDCSEAKRSVTGDRLEFLGRNGRWPIPPA